MRYNANSDGSVSYQVNIQLGIDKKDIVVTVCQIDKYSDTLRLITATKTLRSILEGDTMSKIKLYDKVRIKSKNIIGFVVDVLNDKEKFIVEKVCKLWYNNKGI